MSEPDRARDLDQLLAGARQSLALLQSQARSGRVDLDYLTRRLESLAALLETLAEERQQGRPQVRLAALYEASRLIGSTLELQVVLDQVMDSVIALTGAERGFIMLLNDDGVLAFQVARNLDEAAIESGDFAVSRTITRQVLDSNAPVVTTNAVEDPRFANQLSIMTHSLRSIMATPLRARGRSIGVVYVDNRIRAGTFTEDDLALLDAFAQQAAIAIENARLFTTTDAQLTERVEELRRLRLIDRRLSETLDLDAANAITLEWAARVTGAQAATLYLRDPEAESVAFQPAAFYPKAAAPNDLDDLWDASHPLAGRVLESGEPARLELGGQWQMAVPVRRERQIVGLIALTHDAAFDDAAVEFVTRLADRAAIAIENARLYKEVIDAKNATDEFVSVASHELKTPMTSILGYTDMLRKGIAGPVTEQQLSLLDVVARNVQRMEVLVSDLTDVSRIETGRIFVELKDVDINDVITQVREATIRQIEERRHTLVVNVPPDIPRIKADPRRLVQVLVNLVSNAYKYTPDGGNITIACQRREGAVWIAVHDTGVGMTEAELAQLGRKFWRADNPHVTNEKGTGLGFAITKSLIELMGGALTVQSRPGEGSTFAFTLPVAS
ncbi:MAG: hypothetical protein Kow00120_01760 [Anaerolineae bacterium]